MSGSGEGDGLPHSRARHRKRRTTAIYAHLDDAALQGAAAQAAGRRRRGDGIPSGTTAACGWGLKELVDNEYHGIVGEIIQRIEEDVGATTTERLLTELPSKFGVKPVSVRAYMQTPKFVIHDEWISMANSSSLQLRQLDDVIDGRDRDGNPFWTFAVDARFFEGYSVTGIPPEFAKALGCEPDGAVRVRIENLPQCRELSISWRLASITGASLGYVAEPLKQLSVEPGHRARVTIKGPCLVDLSTDNGSAEHSRGSEADVILERIMQRRKVL